ncbi:cytochrome c oxidase cbb3-type subunit 4 [Catalinimonas alkaloidigena]|uniref:CcoQ/FixQ family Cbb3-type cytochrome c oxidase assembly chaperone n=1 Tax=Catalinimonas alkaloidigena TaxID=1075417 RepID=UPI002406FE7A|nr:CcoQ/FixQ family Cbb3-type cytochrome c oxidase assembly chaperone [Catalinimonas alkaloidigena]MDF9795998.1 cytochrome c oxidase cbb3-type subunit 4 [Catalinimonas alkaloidigena]
MLKFIKYHMETIAGIEIYPLISFIIFFTFFLLLLIWVIKADKREIAEIASLPLDNESERNQQNDLK